MLSRVKNTLVISRCASSGGAGTIALKKNSYVIIVSSLNFTEQAVSYFIRALTITYFAFV